MDENDLIDLAARVRRLEDEAAITKLVLSYGPAADAGLSDLAAATWAEDGVYDWDAAAEPTRGRAALAAMLDGAGHRGLMAAGVAHTAGPLRIELEGDRATVLNYSLIMRREEGRFYLWRVSAVLWELERGHGGWQVRRRTNRLLDETGAGVDLFRDALTDGAGTGR